MIMKAFIREIPAEGDNLFKVRIPFLEDNTRQEFIIEALLCNQPGEFNNYQVGDCVFVSFENNKMDLAIILGRLYTKVEDEVKSYHLVNELKVTSQAVLPENTKIGDYSPRDFFKLYQDKISNSAGEYDLSSLSFELVSVWDE